MPSVSLPPASGGRSLAKIRGVGRKRSANYAIATLMSTLSEIGPLLSFSLSFSLSRGFATNRPHGYCFIAYSILRRGCVGTSRTQLCIRDALTRPCRHFHPVVRDACISLSLSLNDEDEDETVKCARKWRIYRCI